jgi:hypothetical protein
MEGPARRAASYAFRLRSNDAALVEWFDHLVASLPLVTDDRVPAEWTVTCSDDADAPEWTIEVDGEEYITSSRRDDLLSSMLTKLNALVVDYWSGAVCHAGSVARDGLAVLLPADPGSGKTTLTCGLVRAGFEYVTDEGVAFVPGTTRIEPYPKPLSLDRGSWPLFPELEPNPPFLTPDDERLQWQVAPNDIRPDAASGPCDARFVVFPRYVEGADTLLTPMSRAEALIELAKNTFCFNEQSRERLDQLAEVVRACECHRLVVGDLGDAVTRVEELFADE